jgi:hypothetical protein
VALNKSAGLTLDDAFFSPREGVWVGLLSATALTETVRGTLGRIVHKLHRLLGVEPLGVGAPREALFVAQLYRTVACFGGALRNE